MILVIDNYDSFTFNLVQYLGEIASSHLIASQILVKRNDHISITEVKRLQPSAILLSPGPGDPNQSGICLEIIKELSPIIPTLGVCLGHQAIAQAYGGQIIRANKLMHGKTSHVLHKKEGVFKDLPQPLTATRYHSLIVKRENLPSCFKITAWLEDNTIMGIQHKTYPHLQGVQFHPESVLTEAGHKLLSNFLDIAEKNIETANF